MSTAKAPQLARFAQEAVDWLRLFRGGVFEDNFLDVSRLDAGAWESARAELEAAALLTVEWGVLLAGRPYLRLPKAQAPNPPVPAAVQARHVEAYRALTAAVRQAFHAPSPKHGMDIMAREEANFRRAVGWAWDLKDTESAAAMGDIVTRYLERVGRTDDRDLWVTWLALEAAPEEEEEAAAPSTSEETRKPPSTSRETPKLPTRTEATSDGAAVQAAPAPPAPAQAIEPAPASPEGVAVQARETEGAQLQREGAQLQREGTAALAEGQIAQAVELYQRALRCFQDARDTAGVAGTCELFGAMEEAAGRPDAARVWYERAAAKRGR